MRGDPPLIRTYCDRHATRIGPDGLTLKLKAGALPDGRVSIDMCESCRAEFVAWLGDRAAVLIEVPTHQAMPAVIPTGRVNGVAVH